MSINAVLLRIVLVDRTSHFIELEFRVKIVSAENRRSTEIFDSSKFLPPTLRFPTLPLFLDLIFFASFPRFSISKHEFYGQFVLINFFYTTQASSIREGNARPSIHINIVKYTS